MINLLYSAFREYTGELKSTPEMLVMVAISVVFWFIFFGILTGIARVVSKDKKAGYSVAIAFGGMCNDTWVLLAGGIYFYKYGIDPVGNEYFPTIVECDTTGYFISHGFYLIITGLMTKDLAIHHLSSITSGFAMPYFGNSNAGLLGNFCTHLSHIPLHLRGILKDLDFKYNGFYEVVETFYFVIYVFERSILLTYLFYIYLFEYKISVVGTMLLVFVWAQSQLFGLQMIKLFKRKYKNYLERKKKNIQYDWFTENPDCKKLSYYRAKSKEKVF